MRQITAITALGLALLFVLVASRLPDAAKSSADNRADATGSRMNGAHAVEEQAQAKESAPGLTGKAGGIWFW